jgi:hypothetical protein
MVVTRSAACAIVLLSICLGAGACGARTPTPAADEGAVFPITPWELTPAKQVLLDEPRHGIDSLRECGFTTIAFVRPDQLDDLEARRLRGIVGRLGGRVDWAARSDAEIVASLRRVVDGAGESGALLGYFVADEPSAREFPALAKAVAALKRLAPGKLAYVNLLPDYATPEQLGTPTYRAYLERFVRLVGPQLLSYDNYSVQYSRDLRDRARAASHFTNLLAVRQVATRAGLPFWFAGSSNRIRPTTTAPSPANLRLQAYTALAAGARGLTWFTYYAGGYAGAPIDAAGRRTATWSYLRDVNRQVGALGPTLLRLRSTGVFFTAPRPAEGLPPMPGEVVRAARSRAPLMIGEFVAPEGRPYAMIVNLSLERSARVRLTTSATALRRVSPVDGSLVRLPADGFLRLSAGQGALLRL